jgi:chorismate dehydratase
MPKRLGLNGEVYCAPLFSGLQNSELFTPGYDLVATNARKLRNHELDAVFLSPMEYARDSSDYMIVPDLAVVSHQSNGSLLLAFRESLHTVRSLAVDPSFASEAVLASVLLRERGEVAPQIVPAAGGLNQLLAVADAALLIGNATLQNPGVRSRSIDLVEEWMEMTDLPYVHGVWTFHENGLSASHIAALQHARDRGVGTLADIAAVEGNRLGISPDDIRQFLDGFSYSFGSKEQEGFTELLRYAYFHGIIADIPELNFPADDSSGFDVSRN